MEQVHLEGENSTVREYTCFLCNPDSVAVRLSSTSGQQIKRTNLEKKTSAYNCTVQPGCFFEPYCLCRKKKKAQSSWRVSGQDISLR